MQTLNPYDYRSLDDQSAPDGQSAAQNRPHHLETALWLVAAACFALLEVVLGAGAVAHTKANSITTRPTPTQTQTHVPSKTPAEVIGRIEIPALDLSVPITSNVESTSLIAGVGHLPGTAQPGGLGTTVLAGHRDTYLRPLRNIAKGMKILVTDQTGTYTYITDRWEIVHPEDVAAISIKSRPELALVTCYPFYYVGPAPKRFIVHAHLASLIPKRNSEDDPS